MTAPSSMQEAWDDFSGGLPVEGCEMEYQMIQVAFYVGASAIYSIAMQARKLEKEEAYQRMRDLFDELDIFMQSLVLRHSGVAGNA